MNPRIHGLKGSHRSTYATFNGNRLPIFHKNLMTADPATRRVRYEEGPTRPADHDPRMLEYYQTEKWAKHCALAIEVGRVAIADFVAGPRFSRRIANWVGVYDIANATFADGTIAFDFTARIAA